MQISDNPLQGKTLVLPARLRVADQGEQLHAGVRMLRMAGSHHMPRAAESSARGGSPRRGTGGAPPGGVSRWGAPHHRARWGA